MKTYMLPLQNRTFSLGILSTHFGSPCRTRYKEKGHVRVDIKYPTVTWLHRAKGPVAGGYPELSLYSSAGGSTKRLERSWANLYTMTGHLLGTYEWASSIEIYAHINTVSRHACVG